VGGARQLLLLEVLQGKAKGHAVKAVTKECVRADIPLQTLSAAVIGK
jgi:hypothetical protein